MTMLQRHGFNALVAFALLMLSMCSHLDHLAFRWKSCLKQSGGPNVSKFGSYWRMCIFDCLGVIPRKDSASIYQRTSIVMILSAGILRQLRSVVLESNIFT